MLKPSEVAAQPSPDAAKVEEIVDALEALLTDYIEDSDNGTMYWTKEGAEKARAILRRHFPVSANSESEVMPIPDNTNVCKDSSANLKTPGLAGEATARNVAIFGSKSGGWPCQVCGYGHEVGTDCPSGEATEGPRQNLGVNMIYEVIPDNLTRGDWRVEAINHAGEGECFVTIFSGPEAEERAREFASWKNK